MHSSVLTKISAVTTRHHTMANDLLTRQDCKSLFPVIAKEVRVDLFLIKVFLLFTSCILIAQIHIVER